MAAADAAARTEAKQERRSNEDIGGANRLETCPARRAAFGFAPRAVRVRPATGAVSGESSVIGNSS
ncbi:hypothetical protein [Burkholderia sp. Ac-20379]|uniref:hypothetical protein n=1 Tax=Burkholderia sp. Ac-20379 TaxID=2703900 RepID=UPI001982174D|nr:hypothetical protein [Burkholderia sp. Ac-20379]